MSVYVDKSKSICGRMLTSHLLADTESELHAMAQEIGLKRDWFQSKDTPHYDISQSKRKLAINLGAIELSNKEVVNLIRRLRYYKNAGVK